MLGHSPVTTGVASALFENVIANSHTKKSVCINDFNALNFMVSIPFVVILLEFVVILIERSATLNYLCRNLSRNFVCEHLVE